MGGRPAHEELLQPTARQAIHAATTLPGWGRWHADGAAQAGEGRQNAMSFLAARSADTLAVGARPVRTHMRAHAHTRTRATRAQPYGHGLHETHACMHKAQSIVQCQGPTQRFALQHPLWRTNRQPHALEMRLACSHAGGHKRSCGMRRMDRLRRGACRVRRCVLPHNLVVCQGSH
mmetsp:Transcript_29314/g.72057  ORF Transcript_29314/g.72057 Transcript_29314/m.72057 type:complete len:176 (-) Transcript_29314:15-542(-)